MKKVRKAQTATAAYRALMCAGDHCKGFWKDQSGALSYLGVSGALVMMVFGGIGIDMIHAELKRTKIQNTLDRAVLAAADLDNTVAPETVVQEYFDAMNMSGALVDAQADVTQFSKRVQADGFVAMPSNFMSLIGVDTLQAEGTAVAENAIQAYEISLVLDVSGSMGGTKLEQLKTAAKAFIDTVLPAGQNDGTVSINLIPYSAVVNMGEGVAQYYNLQEDHNYSHCALLADNQFNDPYLSPTTALTQVARMDLYGSTDGSDRLSTPWCPENNEMAIVAHSSDAEYLKQQIDALVAGGNTAIDMGLKWGATMLDPDTRPIVNNLIADGLASPSAAGRPFAYEDPSVQKYMVVMTDGQNTSQYDLHTKFKNSNKPSNFYIDRNGTVDVSDDRISIVFDYGRIFDLYDNVVMWTHLVGTGQEYYSWGAYDVASDGPVTTAGVTWDSRRAERNGETDADVFQGPMQMRWRDLYANYKMFEIANRYYWQAYQDGVITVDEYYDKFYAFEVIVNGAQADERLSNVCAAARQEGTMIYTIGVEAPAAGLAAMRDCASSDAHYYDVSGSELEETFASIARTLTMLRLTQ